jgi:hypothetical protein
MIRCAAICIAALTSLTMVACKKTPAADSVCSYEPLPATTDVPAGQGAILTQAVTDAYFYAMDSAGKQVGSAHVNGILPIKPGEYRLKVNNSTHAADVKSNTITKCSTGGVLVSGKTDENYYLLDGAGTQLAAAHVGAALSVFPGTYQVRLNNSVNPANVQAGPPLSLKPGTVSVDAPTDENYYVFDSAGTQLAGSHVGRPVGLFAGSYTVKINNSEAKADVRAGEAASLPVSTLVTEGSTDENYYVFSTAATQLAAAHLGRPLALFPGSYNVKLNNSSAPASVAAGSPVTIRAGSVNLQGSTDESYYVYDKAGVQLASAHLGRAVSLMPGDYTAKLNNAPLAVRTEAGSTNDYPTGTVAVKASGSDRYYVLDPAGTQLGSSQFNQPISLPAGKYSVKVGNETRPVEITAGQAAVVTW